jgi:hypothetical protein
LYTGKGRHEVRILRPSLELVVLLTVAVLSTSADAQVTVGGAVGVDIRLTDPGADSSGFYPELSLRVPLGKLVAIELAGGYHAREIDVPTYGSTLSEHESLRQYQFMLGVIVMPALSPKTRLLIPIGASATTTTGVTTGETIGFGTIETYSYKRRGTDFGGYVGLGVDSAVGEKTSVFILGRYVQCPSGDTPNYVTAVVGVGYHF